MKAVICAFVATICYTGETVIADNKLSKISPFAITLIMGVVTVIISAIGLGLSPSAEIKWPRMEHFFWISIVVIMAFAADLLHFYALHYQVGAAVLCTSYALMPVIASMMKGEMPSLRLAIAWFFAALALFLAYKEVIK